MAAAGQIVLDSLLFTLMRGPLRGADLSLQVACGVKRMPTPALQNTELR